MKGFVHSADIERMLRERIGFGAYPGSTIERCIGRRMEAIGIEDKDAYLSFLYSSTDEQDELIEEIVVPETWFFRDCEPFVYLRKYASERASSFSPGRPLRALSVPASSGEEAYSIAITLMEAGLMPEQFSVHALDISRRALRKAREALYSDASFREKDCELRGKYFDEIGSMFLVRPEARARVRFTHGNVLRETDLELDESFDVVFFRNLLIYLDEASRKLAVRNVERALRKGGLLVLGYAEPQHLFFPGYIPVDHPRSHASRKPIEEVLDRAKSPRVVQAVPLEETLRSVANEPFRSAPPAGGGISRITRPAPEQRREGACAAPAAKRSDVMERARGLADSGMYSAAEQLVSEHLKSDATCTEAHYLLGITALARGDEEDAVTHLSRVIYLDPNHHDALLHLSLIMDRLGRKDQAARYRKRMVRIGKGAPRKVGGGM